MAIKDAGAATQAWQAAAGAGQAAFTAGVQATNVDVVGKAIAQSQKLLTNFNQAVTSGRWQRALSDVGTAGWKQATVAKAQNYSTGVGASGPKYQAAYAAMLPTMQSLQSQIDSMPSTTLQDSIARASAWITGMHNYKLNQS